MRMNAIRFAVGCVLAAHLAGRAEGTTCAALADWPGGPPWRGVRPRADQLHFVPGVVRQPGPRLLHWAFQAGERLALRAARTSGRLGRQQRQRALGPDEHPAHRIRAGASAGHGQCALIVDLCERTRNIRRGCASQSTAPFDRDLEPGGSEDSLRGEWQVRPRRNRCEVEFPAPLCGPATTRSPCGAREGSWMVFDALRLETPGEAKLAPATSTVIRSVYDSALRGVEQQEDASHPPHRSVSRRRARESSRWQIANGEDPGAGDGSGLAGSRSAGARRRLRGKITRVRAERRRSSAGRNAAEPEGLPDRHAGRLRGYFQGHGAFPLDDAPGPWMPFSMVKTLPRQPDGRLVRRL